MTIDKRSGLLVLTNRRVCYYFHCEREGCEGGRPHAHLYLSVPLPTLERMAILTSLTHKVVQLRLDGFFSVAQRDWKIVNETTVGDVNFDMASGVNLDHVLSEIQAAGERCPLPLPSSRRN